MIVKLHPTVPKTQKEAFCELDDLLDDDIKEKLITAQESFEFHFSIGLWIRNHWIHGKDEADVKHLALLFRDNPDCFHPDDLSSKIIEYYQRYLKRNRG